MNNDAPAVMSRGEQRRSLGLAIKARRRELGLSQQALAARVVAHGDATFRQSDVSRLECERVHLPDRARLEHVAAALGLPLAELLDRAGWTSAGPDGGHARGTGRTAHVVSAGAAPRTVSSPSPRIAVPGGSQPASTGTPALNYDRLHASIASARATRARTQELLAESAALLQRCFPSTDRRATPAVPTDSLLSTVTTEQAPGDGVAPAAATRWEVMTIPAASGAGAAATSPAQQPTGTAASSADGGPPVTIAPTLAERAMWLAVAGHAQLSPAMEIATLLRLAADLGYIVEYQHGAVDGASIRHWRHTAMAWIRYGDGVLGERVVADSVPLAICLVVGRRLQQPRRVAAPRLPARSGWQERAR